MHIRFWITLAVVLAFTGGARAAVSPDRHVVVISIDGLRPEFYLPGKTSAACPTLRSLRDRGAHAKRAISVYPSFTYPAHAAIVTGVRPDEHGITGNGVFTPPTQKEGRGFWYASDLLVPAIWDRVHAAGGTVGAVSWPCSAGAKAIEWNLPEFWRSSEGSEITLVRRHAKPATIAMIEQAAAPMNLATLLDGKNRDSFLAAGASAIIREKKPSLMLIHFVESDHEQHRVGPSSPTIAGIMRHVDGLVSGMVDVVRDAGLEDRTTFIVLGDHGFSDVKSRILPNVLLARHGFITLEKGRVTGWTAMVQNSGGSAGVYVNPDAPKGTGEAVLKLLAEHAEGADGKRLYTMIPKQELVKLGGPRKAIGYMEAEPGYMFSLSWTGTELVRSAPVKGNHGYLPQKPEMATGFLIWGAGIKPGVTLPEIELIDVAPTIAALLGIEFPGVKGRVLQEVLAESKSRKGSESKSQD